MRGQRALRKRIGRRRLARSRRGVAAIIGALFAVLIFLTVFGLVLSQALPVWMAQDETAFTESAQGALASLQSTIGLQSISGAPTVAFTPISLSSTSVPVLASATIASLAFAAPTPSGFVNVSWSTSSGPAYQNRTLGRLVVGLPNRYIPAEALDFEDGAVLETVGAGAPVVAFGPAFSLSDRAGNLSLSISIVSMSGASSAVNGPGTRSITDTLLASSSYDHSSPGFSVTVEIGSSFACAWGAYYLGVLSYSGVPTSAVMSTGPTNCLGGGSAGSLFSLTISGVTWASLESVVLSVSVGGG